MKLVSDSVSTVASTERSPNVCRYGSRLCAVFDLWGAGEGAKVSLTDIAVVLQQQVHGAAKGKAKLPWLSVPPLPRKWSLGHCSLLPTVRLTGHAQATKGFLRWTLQMR